MIHGRSHGDGYYFDVVVYNGLLLLNMNVVEILLSMNVVEILLNMNIVVIEQGGGKQGWPYIMVVEWSSWGEVVFVDPWVDRKWGGGDYSLSFTISF